MATFYIDLTYSFISLILILGVVTMQSLYKEVLRGRFIERPNRFVVLLDLEGKRTLCHLPNPGRMWELLFPGVIFYVTPHPKEGAKTQYRVIGIERQGVPIMLDTNYSNDIAQYLVDHQLIPGWEEWSVVRREYTVGHSRFDLLLANERGEEFLLEVKSCTLFSKKGAMFPDAITERGRKHLLHLADLQEQGYHTGILFLVQWNRAQWFLPDYHTDLAFAQTFKSLDSRLDWKALALSWDQSFSLPKVVGLCKYPQHILESEAKDAGDYIMVLKLPESKDIEIGSKGIMHFPQGYYLYVGSAKANLSKRIERHKRKRKKMHWHLDYFRGHCEVVAAIPVRTSADLECPLAQAIHSIADWQVEGFGSSDCTCSAHLFGMKDNPIHNKELQDVIEDFRMNRLDAFIE